MPSISKRSVGETRYPGVNRNGRGFVARLRVDGKLRHLGTCKTEKEAYKIWSFAKAEKKREEAHTYPEESAQRKALLAYADKLEQSGVEGDPLFYETNIVHGWGINDAEHPTIEYLNGKPVRHTVYNAWQNVVKRCCDERHYVRRPTYEECTICDRWQHYSSFEQDAGRFLLEGKTIDKDLLFLHNKHYSPETCCYVSQHLNSALTGMQRRNTSGFPGTYWDKWSRKFAAQVGENGKQRHLGRYSTVEEAHQAYCETKADYLLTFQDSEPHDPRIKPALIRRVWDLRLAGALNVPLEQLYL